jgi:phenylpropionate dioxygenase-like ring-hydroxylating dioxygenase large terminal subunit
MTNNNVFIPNLDDQPKKRLSGFSPKWEGSDGLFTQSWFPICSSEEVIAGTAKSFSFLDGRVIVFRNSMNTVRVLSAFCPHMGADLASGDICNDTLRCGFHHWQFDIEGNCVSTGIGTPAPSQAKLFRYPCVERWGIVFAFNGLEPLWDLPDFRYPDEDLVFKSFAIEGNMPVDPWIQCANTPDMQHIKTMHGINFNCEDPDEEVEWTPYSMSYYFDGVHRKGEKLENWVAIHGTSLYWQETFIDGQWFGFMVPMGLVSPAKTRNYFVLCARKDMGEKDEVDKFISEMIDLELSVVGEDVDVLSNMNFKPGAVIKDDKTLLKFFKYIDGYPRAHPGGPFIK